MQEILCQFHNNGTSMFVLSIILYIAIYHLILYKRNKDITYFYYGFYAFFLFTAYSLNVKNNFYSNLIAPLFDVLYNLRFIFAALYFFCYIKFSFYLVNVFEYTKRTYKIVKRLLYFFLGYVAVSHLYIFSSGNFNLLASNFNLILSPVMLLLFFATVYMMVASKNPLKKYLLTGSLILVSGSVISLILYSFVGSSDLKCYAHPIVFTALLIENIIFSLALGKKQRTILEDKILYEKQLNEERLNLLRSNLNPHFIFNVLNSIKSLIIESDVKKSVQSLNLFAKLMRIFLNSTQESEHSLKKEIELIEIYIKAENIRFEEPLDLEIKNNLTVSVEKIFLPSMILQPFIENVIKHGFTYTTKNKKILMSLNHDDSFLNISLLDNGKGLKEKFAYRNKSGLFITKKRIEFFAKKNNSGSSILIQNRKSQKGVVVEIKIPLLIKGNH